MIPTTKIVHLTNEEFMIAYASGELNSLDLPAREYFERQDIIKEEMVRRTKEGMDPLNAVMKYVPNVEKNLNFRAHLVLYAQEGAQPNFIVCASKDHAMRIISEFKKTGKIEVQDPFSGDVTEKEVKTIAYSVTQEMWRRFGDKTITDDDNDEEVVSCQI